LHQKDCTQLTGLLLGLHSGKTLADLKKQHDDIVEGEKKLLHAAKDQAKAEGGKKGGKGKSKAKHGADEANLDGLPLTAYEVMRALMDLIKKRNVTVESTNVAVPHRLAVTSVKELQVAMENLSKEGLLKTLKGEQPKGKQKTQTK